MAPPGLVLEIELTSPPRQFHVSPGTARHEAGQVTVTGACADRVECVHLQAASLDALYPLVVEAARSRHKPAEPSVHHGSRSVTMRWAGGACSIVDDAFHQIVSDDTPRFMAAYDAIQKALIAARTPAK